MLRLLHVELRGAEEPEVKVVEVNHNVATSKEDGDNLLSVAKVMLQELVVAVVGQRRPKIAMSGSTLCNTCENRICCLLVFSSSPRKGPKRMPTRCPIKTSVLRLRRVQST